VRGLRDRLSPPVLDYETDNGVYKPFHLDIDGDRRTAPTDKRVARCARGPVRAFVTGSPRSTRTSSRANERGRGLGIGDVLLARATDESLVENGQDGGFVSALLIYALENDVIDAALVSGLEGDGSTWRAVPRWRARART